MMPCPALAWGAVLLDESLVNRGPDDLVRGDRHSVELTKARNQNWKPQDPSLGPPGALRARSLQTIDDIRNQLGEVHTYLCHDGINLLGGRAPCRIDRGP